ncbi:MAG: hypothetical protein ACRC6E_09590, partial [Fusobacteriaceae bacterium]
LLKVEKINTINYGKEVYLSNLQDTLYNSKQKAYEASNSGDPIMMKQSTKNVRDVLLKFQKFDRNTYNDAYIGGEIESLNLSIITGQMNNDKIQLGIEMDKQLAEGKSVESYAVGLKGYYDSVIDKYSGSEGLKNFEKDYGTMSVKNRDTMLKYIEGEANENKKTLQRIYNERYSDAKKQKAVNVLIAQTNGPSVQQAENLAGIKGSEDRVVASMSSGTLMVHLLGSDPNTAHLVNGVTSNEKLYNNPEAVKEIAKKFSVVSGSDEIAFLKTMVNRENPEFNATKSFNIVKTALFQHGKINKDMPKELRDSILIASLTAGGMTTPDIKNIKVTENGELSPLAYRKESNITNGHNIDETFEKLANVR